MYEVFIGGFYSADFDISLHSVFMLLNCIFKVHHVVFLEPWISWFLVVFSCHDVVDQS